MSIIIDLGMHPFADTFVSKEQYSLSEPVYPLQCVMDKKTGEIKLKYITTDDDRYNLYSYSYTSSNSKTSRNHWDAYSTEIHRYISNGSKILEIGSNDGYLSEQFSNKGHIIRGVDPSKFMCKIAQQRGVRTYNEFFNLNTSEIIKEDYGDIDVVIANNVFNHANDPVDFAHGVNNALSVGGLFVFELPYWLFTIKDKKFDQIYHEHVTYFTVKYAYNLLRQCGLQIEKVNIVDYHGGSIRVYCRKTDNVGLSPTVESMILREENMGLFEEVTYERFMKSITKSRNSLMTKLYNLKNIGRPIIGIGAAAKANTFLNFHKIDNSILDYITDASEYKKGKFTPLTRIPIVGDEIFSKYDNVLALILSWNISDALKQKIRNINNKVQFL